ncbi:MAG: cytochrome c [Acidobacteria bacterium]|nr:cytochrome c [Acidobacteriota bacterium]
MPSSANGTKNYAKIGATFSKDVAPIFFQKCAPCHRPGQLAPFSILSFKEARPWARAIKERVVARQMPPWGAASHFVKFENDSSLTQSEIDTIARWVDEGAPEGNRKELPPLPRFPGEWKIGTPDVILTMPEAVKLEAQGADEYLDIPIPTNFTEDKWVQAVEIHPGNNKVVHHVIAFVQTPDMLEAVKAMRKPEAIAKTIYYADGTLIRARMDAPVYDDGCSAPNGGIARGSGLELGLPLGFFTPGKDPDVFPLGIAKFIPANSRIILQIHYSKTTGKVETDRTSVGFQFAKQPPQKTMMSMGAMNNYFKIPPGADNHEVTACFTFSRDSEIYTMLPHMHVRGKAMKYELLYTDGRRETILSVPKFDFNWQLMYRLEKPLLVPKGTKLMVTAHFDNSPNNKYNPDATKAVRFGDPTYDEMMIGYFDFVSKTPPRMIGKLDARIVAAYAGAYAIGNVVFKVIQEGDKLMIVVPGQPKVEAIPASETKFFSMMFDGEITFIKDDKGETTEMLIDLGGRKLRARKVNKLVPPTSRQ